MGRDKNLSVVVRQLKRAVKKVKFIILSLKWKRYWRLIITNTKTGANRMRRHWSFDDRLMGLFGCFEDEKSDKNCTSKRRLQRTTSCVSEDHHDHDIDIDRKAEVFIANFRCQLLIERQVSWKLSYWQEHSSDMDMEDEEKVHQFDEL